MTAVQYFREKRRCLQSLQTFCVFLTLCCKNGQTGFCYEYTVQHFCDKRAAKNNQKHYIRQQVNILAIHVTGGVSVWFFKPFLMYPFSLRQLGSDNTAELYLFTVLLSLIFYCPQLKKVKNCRNYNASGTFTYYFISLKRKLFISRTSLLRTLAITDTKIWCP